MKKTDALRDVFENQLVEMRQALLRQVAELSVSKHREHDRQKKCIIMVSITQLSQILAFLALDHSPSSFT